MDRDETVPPRRRAHEGRAQAGLEVVEAAAQRQESRVHGRVRGVVAKQAGLDQVARGRGLGALGKKEDERRLLLRQPRLPLAEADDPAGRVELQAAEAIRPRTARAALDEAR